MVASIDVVEKNGAGGTTTVKTGATVRFKLADNATVDTSNAMTIPNVGSTFSFQKYLQLYLNTAPSSSISNVRCYTTTSTTPFGTGVTLYWQNTGTYATPAQETTTSGYQDLFGGTSGAAFYTSGSPLTLNAGTVATNATGVGVIGNLLKMCLVVQSTASVGTLSAANWTFSYDEV